MHASLTDGQGHPTYLEGHDTHVQDLKIKLVHANHLDMKPTKDPLGANLCMYNSYAAGPSTIPNNMTKSFTTENKRSAYFDLRPHGLCTLALWHKINSGWMLCPRNL